MNLNLAQMKILKQSALDSKKYQYLQRPAAQLEEMLLITFKSTEYIPQQSLLSDQLGYQSIFIQTSSESFQLIKKDISAQNYKINSFSSFYKDEVEKQDKINSLVHIQKIIQNIRSVKNMYLIRREFPEGYQISVTFIEALNHWSISYGQQCVLIKVNDFKESTSQNRSILQEICYFWAKYCQKIKIQQVKEYLKSHIIRGILSFDFSWIKWFESYEHTSQGYKLEDGLNKLQQINMDTISKSRVQLITNQDHLHRVVQDFSLSILASTSKQNQQFAGRSRLYFTNSNLQVQLILNINPFRLYLTQEIKKLLTKTISIQQGVQYLIVICQQLKKYVNYSIPYPFRYYQQIYSNIRQFVTQVGISKDLISSKFEEILRIVLYMSFKQISIKKYGGIFYFNQSLRKNILKINIDSYGPIGCKVITFFSFISCGGSIDPIKQKVKNIFSEANLHHDELQSTNLYEYAIGNQKNEEKSILLFNFFLNKIPDFNQWRSFCCDHQKRQNNDIFYRLIYICQNKSSFLRIQEDFFPISIQTISNAFYKAYLLRKCQRLLQGRVQQLRSVTSSINSMKNMNLALEAKTIEIKYDQETVNSELAKRMSTILKSQINEENVNNYYLLLSGLEKYKSEQNCQISEASLSCLLSQIFFNVPTIKPQGWL